MERYTKSFDGIRIYYRFNNESNNKPVLVFLHGIGGNWTVWKEEITFFHRMGYSTMTFDLRGHGLSEVPLEEKSYNFTNFTKDLKYILDKENIKNFILIGHSLGGGIAINYCGLCPKQQPLAVILVEAAHRYPFEHGREFHVNHWVSSFLRFIAEHEHFRKHHFPHMKEIDFTKHYEKSEFSVFWRAIHVTPLKSIIATIDAVQAYSFNHLQQTEELLKSLDLPVLIIAGSEDSVIPVEFAEELYHLIKRSKLKVLMGAYHRVPLQEPEELSMAIHEFLTSLEKNHHYKKKVKKNSNLEKSGVEVEIDKLKVQLKEIKQILRRKQKKKKVESKKTKSKKKYTKSQLVPKTN